MDILLGKARLNNLRRSAIEAKEQVARRRQLLYPVAGGVLLVTVDGRILEANSEACRLLGYSRKDLIATRVNTFIEPAENRLKNAWCELICTSKCERSFRVLSKYRLPFTVQASMTLCGESESIIILLTGVRLESANGDIGEAEESYNTLAQQVPKVVYLTGTDEDFSALCVSPQLEEMSGYAPVDWLLDSEPWVKTLQPADFERTLAGSIFARQKGQPLDAEYRLFDRDWRAVWVRDQSVLVLDEEGHSEHWPGILLDITERNECY